MHVQILTGKGKPAHSFNDLRLFLSLCRLYHRAV